MKSTRCLIESADSPKQYFQELWTPPFISTLKYAATPKRGWSHSTDVESHGGEATGGPLSDLPGAPDYLNSPLLLAKHKGTDSKLLSKKYFCWYKGAFVEMRIRSTVHTVTDLHVGHTLILVCMFLHVCHLLEILIQFAQMFLSSFQSTTL